MSKTKRTASLLLAALLIFSVLVFALPASADTAMGGMETNVPDTDIGGATGGGELVTMDPAPESETASPATDVVTTPVTSAPATDGMMDNTDDGLGWLGIVICVAVVAAIVIVVVALLPKKKEH